jgi:hypothetical protein
MRAWSQVSFNIGMEFVSSHTNHANQMSFPGILNHASYKTLLLGCLERKPSPNPPNIIPKPEHNIDISVISLTISLKRKDILNVYPLCLLVPLGY